MHVRLFVCTRDQWFWQNFINSMCDIKFWKGNENLRSVYKKNRFSKFWAVSSIFDLFHLSGKNIPVSSSQFSLGSSFVAFSPKGLFIKAVQLLFQPVSPGRCMIFCLNGVKNRANVYPKNTFPKCQIWTTLTAETYINRCAAFFKVY
jgi:hypothetical protein